MVGLQRLSRRSLQQCAPGASGVSLIGYGKTHRHEFARHEGKARVLLTDSGGWGARRPGPHEKRQGQPGGRRPWVCERKTFPWFPWGRNWKAGFRLANWNNFRGSSPRYLPWGDRGRCDEERALGWGSGLDALPGVYCLWEPDDPGRAIPRCQQGPSPHIKIQKIKDMVKISPGRS